MVRVPVAAEHRYEVLIGAGVADQLLEVLPAGTAQVLVVHAGALEQRARELGDVLTGAGVVVTHLLVPDGEAAKNIDVLAGAWDLLGERAFTRSDLVVSLGGGAVTDVAGFIAATWLRGVGVIHIPSTLLGMVDAAVGGKTGINTAAGKNLVGSIHSPLAVLCDPELLTSLPAADLRAGMAEVAKCGFIHDSAILELIEADPQAALDVSGPVLVELIRRAVQVKADVVGSDLREADLRETLNYGHTLAHAIENAHGYSWRHGDAVAVGMVFVAELAHRTGGLPAEVVARHRSVLSALGLPTTYAGPWEPLREAMRRDKKSRGNTLRFVVLEDIGKPARLQGPSEEDLEFSFKALDGH